MTTFDSRHRIAVLAATLSALTVPSTVANASFSWFNNNYAGWQQATDAYTTLGFTEFAHNTLVTNQYAGLGVLFTDPDPNVVWINGEWPIDGHGINGVAVVELTFANPTFSVAAHGLGFWTVELYSGSTQIFAQSHIPTLELGFTGVVSSMPFDRVVFHGLPPIPDIDPVFFDNFYFASVPGPGGLAVIATAAAMLKLRRRR